jgi:hypothetical protein
MEPTLQFFICAFFLYSPYFLGKKVYLKLDDVL